METERLRKIAEKSGKLTTEEKRFIADLCTELGVKFSPTSTRCGSCYKDAAVQCYRILSSREKQPAGKYVLKSWVDVIFKGVRVNAATITDEQAEWLLSNGFDKEFFEVCK